MLDENGHIIPSLDILEDVQSILEQRIASHPWLATDGKAGGIVVLAEDKGNIESRIEANLSKLGLAINVLLPSVGVSFPNLPASSLDDCLVQVTVTENTTINRSSKGSGKKASAAALLVFWRLHHFQLPGLGSTLFLQKPGIVRVLDTPEDEIAYDIFFKASLPLEAPDLAEA